MPGYLFLNAIKTTIFVGGSKATNNSSTRNGIIKYQFLY